METMRTPTETIVVRDRNGTEAEVEAKVLRTFVWQGRDGAYPQSQGQAVEQAFEDHGITSWYNYETATAYQYGRYVWLVTIWF